MAARLGYRHLDSGAFYRAITLAALRAGIPVDEWEELRLAGAAIKDNTLHHLDEHLVRLEATLQERGAVGVLAYSLPAYLKPEIHRTSIQFGSVPQDTARRRTPSRRSGR